MTKFNLSIKPKLLNRLKEFSVANHRKISDSVEMILEEYLEYGSPKAKRGSST